MASFKITNPWIGYAQRSYRSIKKAILTRLQVTLPEMTDHTESNPFIILVSIFSGIAEMLNYYIDRMARESFMETTTLYASALQLASQHDYRVKLAAPAQGEVEFTLLDDNGDESAPPIGAPINIPQYTVLESTDGTKLVTTEAATIVNPFSRTTIKVKQMQVVASSTLAQTTGVAGERYNIPTNVAADTLSVEVDSVAYDNVYSLGLSLFDDKVFIVSVGSDGLPYIEFGDGVNGELPSSALDIDISYYSTKGVNGNLAANTVTTIVDSISIPVDWTLEVNNNKEINGGAGIEGLESIRRNAPLIHKTQLRAITNSDFADIAKLHPTVGKAKSLVISARKRQIIVAPRTEGVLTSLSGIDTFVTERSPDGMYIEITPAPIARFISEWDVKGINQIGSAQMVTDINRALQDFMSWAKTDINTPLRVSDFYALIDNLSSVDYVNLVDFYVIPGISVVSGNDDDGEITITKSGDQTDSSISWYIVIAAGAPGTVTLYRNGTAIGTIPFTGSTLSSDGWEFSHNYAVTTGSEFSFKTYKPKQNIEIDDNSIPVFNSVTVNVL